MFNIINNEEIFSAIQNVIATKSTYAYYCRKAGERAQYLRDYAEAEDIGEASRQFEERLKNHAKKCKHDLFVLCNKIHVRPKVGYGIALGLMRGKSMSYLAEKFSEYNYVKEFLIAYADGKIATLKEEIDNPY